MKNFNEIANILASLGSVNIQQDTMGELAEKAPTKEQIMDSCKKETNFKWMAFDVATSVVGMVINQYRQNQFKTLEKKSEADANAYLKEREQRIQNLKENLGIVDLEECVKKQDEALENIAKMLSHLVAENKKGKKEKHTKDLLPTTSKIKKNEEEKDNYWN